MSSQNDVEKTNETGHGDSRAVWQAVKYLGGADRRSALRQPSKSQSGEEIRTSEELAEAWRAFCAGHKIRLHRSRIKETGLRVSLARLREHRQGVGEGRRHTYS